MAMLSIVGDPHTWRQLRDVWELPVEDASWAAEWAMGALLDRLDEPDPGEP